MKINDSTLHDFLIVRLGEDYFGEQRLCDVQIMCREKVFKAHSFVLTSLSTFFEEQIFVQNSRTVKVDLDVESLKTVLNFCYTSEIEIDAENVQKILIAADSLHLERVRKLGLNYLITTQINEATVFEMFKVSQIVKRFNDVAIACVEFIGQNFTTLVDSKKFVDLKIDVLRALFTLMFDDSLQSGFVVPHLFRFKAVKNWMSHNYEVRGKHGDELLEFVDFKCINIALLKRMLDSEKFLMKCKKTKKYIFTMVNGNTKKEADNQSFGGKKLIVVNANGQDHSMVEFSFVHNTCKVYKKAILPFETTTNVLSVQNNSFFYAVKGIYLRRVCIMEDLHYQTFTLEKKISAYSAGGLVGNTLYTHGGIKEIKEFRLKLDGNMTTIDLARNFNIDISVEDWFPRYDHSCAVYDSKLFFTGGRMSSGIITKSCFMYDTKTKKYTELSPMLRARCKHQMLVLGEMDMLVAIGGVGSDGKILRSVEVYEVGTNTWKVQALLNTIMLNFCAAYIDSKVYVVGENKVECWDLKGDFKVLMQLNQKLTKSCCYVATSQKLLC